MNPTPMNLTTMNPTPLTPTILKSVMVATLAISISATAARDHGAADQFKQPAMASLLDGRSITDGDDAQVAVHVGHRGDFGTDEPVTVKTIDATPVPEPSIVGVLGISLCGMLLRRRARAADPID